MTDLFKTKLCILFMLQSVDLPLTSEQLVRVFSGYDWINYFELQQSLAELTERDMLAVHITNNKQYYALAPLGHQSLEHFQNELALSLRKRLLSDAYTLRDIARQEAECVADYQKLGDRQYVARLQAIENSRVLMDIKLNLPTSTQARAVCDAWKNKMESVYTLLLSSEE